ncbi:AMP-binding protein [Ectobacillus panaciterrae]|uniref:AMP-binding protein n=1 Tax=Ectobacillus panaciterrae TaxID=363872 RepID=UPI00042A8C10|nr:AMP-binding protein [Ectobacillus panaciterrae]
MATITCPYKNYAYNQSDRIAIQTHNQNLSYRQWYELVCKTVNWLTSHSYTNKTIGILMPNGIPFLQLFAGAAAAGWTVAPLDIKWREEELQKRLSLCNPSIVITTKDMYDNLKSFCPNAMIWEECVEEINKSPFTDIQEANEELPFYMGFTSGSTGEPKAFIRSHESWVASFSCNKFDFHMNENEHVVIPGALIHSHFLYGAISTLFLGGTVYLLEKFSPSQTLSVLHKHPVTAVYMVPTMIEALLKENCVIEKHVKIISSGAKWEADSKQRIRNMFRNLSMYEFYGASELSFVTVLSDQDNKERPGSVGKPCHNVEIQIRNTNQSLAAPNQVGKIYVRSKMTFMGYLYADAHTIHSIQDEDGWSTVHDMGYLDEAGFLYIVGREKNIILYGGINIFPEEIETVLSLHPDVEAVAVIGLADSYWGQIVTAVIKGKAAKIELRKLCQMKLASYKVPRKWYFTDEMPLTTSGKIARPQIKEMVESQVNSY